MANWQETCKYIPEGVQTLSKRPCVYVDGVYPKYITRGEGCCVFDENNKRYIDFVCGLGPNILGYGNERIRRAVLEVLDNGNLFSLPHPKETELAILIRNVIPSMELMRFVKTGSESCASAIRIARAYTGRMPVICSGYMGQQDWYLQTTSKNAGCDTSDVTQIGWGQVQTLEKLVKEKKPAAFITEPYILQQDEALIEKYLKEIRRICNENGVVLIFDENVTGFRTRKLTAQNYWKVYPDLTCLGKAMANGFPMACVGGKREIMNVLEGDCFVSSTFGGDLFGIVAAIETINQLKSSAVIEHIWQMGNKLKTAFNQAADSLMMRDKVKCIGLPPRTKFVFPTPAHLGLFWQECLKRGVMFGFAQFISAAHSHYHLDVTCAAVRDAMKTVNKYWDKPLEKLEGSPPQETLRQEMVDGKEAKSTLYIPTPQKEPIPVPSEVVNAKPDETGFVGQEPPKPKKEKPTCAKCGQCHWPFQKCKEKK